MAETINHPVNLMKPNGNVEAFVQFFTMELGNITNENYRLETQRHILQLLWESIGKIKNMFAMWY